MVGFLLDILFVAIIYIIIAFLWTTAEKMIYGHVTPRIVDDVVALVLAISLYSNIK